MPEVTHNTGPELCSRPVYNRASYNYSNYTDENNLSNRFNSYSGSYPMQGNSDLTPGNMMPRVTQNTGHGQSPSINRASSSSNNLSGLPTINSHENNISNRFSSYSGSNDMQRNYDLTPGNNPSGYRAMPVINTQSIQPGPGTITNSGTNNVQINSDSTTGNESRFPNITPESIDNALASISPQARANYSGMITELRTCMESVLSSINVISEFMLENDVNHPYYETRINVLESVLHSDIKLLIENILVAGLCIQPQELEQIVS